MLRSILNSFRLDPDDRELMLSQARAFARQVPLLYFVIISSMTIMAWSFHEIAPPALVYPPPVAFGLICVWRMWKWFRPKDAELDYKSALKLVRLTVPFTILLGTGFTVWVLSLFPYGDAYHQAHVAFFMAITVISCVFCLMHLRIAALALTVQIIGPFAFFFGFSDQPEFRAIALNVILVTGAMILILLTYQRDFAQLVASRRSLQEKQVEAERLSEENMRLAQRDALTKLPNRRAFFRELDQRIEFASEGGKVYLGLIDLDGFKPINDIYGHSIGDRVLVEAANRLARLPGSPYVARLGGDEFAVCVSENMSLAEVRLSCQRICAALSAPYELGFATVRLSGSIGVCEFPRSASSRQQLVERADYALYNAKKGERGRAVMFSNQHLEELREHVRLHQALMEANFEAELSVAFQPKIDLRSEQLVGFEALARWTSPMLGTISPADFIPAAERAGMISELTACLLRKALADALTWPEPHRVAFNLSTRDFASEDGVERLVRIVEASGIDPCRIQFEVTETAFMTDPAQARTSLLQLKALGVTIALDDFGTGHSSLSYVHRLPLDAIKIDKSFVASIETDEVARNIVKTVVGLCKNLNLQCVVEGIETNAQLLLLRHLGCEIGQGYLFSRPMPQERVADYILGQQAQRTQRGRVRKIAAA